MFDGIVHPRLARRSTSVRKAMDSESVPAEAAQDDRGQARVTLRAEDFEAAVTAHFPSIWRFLRRLGVPASDVDDAAQEVVLVAARKLSEIVVGSERAFFLSTAYHVARHLRDFRIRKGEVSDEALLELYDAAPDPESMAAQRQERALLDEILAQMPLDLRVVFVLSEIEDQTAPSIARVLDLPIGTVASRLRRARADFDARVERLRASARRRGTPQ
jgi:RNA polymerase sigma-70 factor (ECF subfamily)